MAYFLINLFINYKFFYSKVKINYLIPLSFGYHVLKKLVKKNLDIYKLIVEKNLLVQYLKTFVIKKILLLAI